jgi:hypothetical protein
MIESAGTRRLFRRAGLLTVILIPAIWLGSNHLGRAQSTDPAAQADPVAAAAALPAGMRSWQCVPSAIRNDGTDSFRLEVDVNGAVTRVTLNSISSQLVPPQTPPFDFRDDGQAPDLVAGDHVYTAGPFRYETTATLRANYLGDADSPAGVDFASIGDVVVTEVNGVTNTFLVRPSIGLVRADLPATVVTPLSTSVQMSPHLVNINNAGRSAQTYLRGGNGNLADLTVPLYAALPDTMDFLVLLPTSKVEWVPRTAAENYNSGAHVQVKVNWTGTGQAPLDNTAGYGSKGRLLGINVVDAGDRGLVTNNLLHEFTHTWSAYEATSLGITDGAGHYDPRSNVGSLLGGQLWSAAGGGAYNIDCNEGRSGAHHAAALDKYMMGLIDGSLVPPVLVYNAASPLPLMRCGTPISDVVTNVDISRIQGLYGVRTPLPTAAQRDFRFGFVAESTGRFLTATEMTFYETLAAHFAKTLDPAAPDPYLSFNWAPVTRFFGEGTTWSTVVRRSLDLTGDGSIDHADAVAMRSCMTGASVPATPACLGLDQDGDGDVDLDDFGLLQRCLTAAGVTPSPACAD